MWTKQPEYSVGYTYKLVDDLYQESVGVIKLNIDNNTYELEGADAVRLVELLIHNLKTIDYIDEEACFDY